MIEVACPTRVEHRALRRGALARLVSSHWLLLIGADSAIARSVLTAERMDSDIVLLRDDSHGDFRPTPMLLLVQDGRLVSVAHIGSDVLAARTFEERLMASLSTLLGGRAVPPLTKETR